VQKPACSRTTTSMFIPGLDGAFATVAVSSLLCYTYSVGTQDTASARTRIRPLHRSLSYARETCSWATSSHALGDPRVAEFCRLRAGRDGLGTAVLLLLLLHGGGCGRAGAWRLPTLFHALSVVAHPTRSAGACACGSMLETFSGSSPPSKRWDAALQSTVGYFLVGEASLDG
jgi:hypothetical protein